MRAMGFPIFRLSSVSTALLPILLLITPSSSQITFGNAPTSVTSSSSPSATPPPLSGYGSIGPNSGDDDGNDDDDDVDNGISNYYYLLIAVFVVIAIVSLWVLIRRRRTIARHMRESRGGAAPGGGPSPPGGRRGANSRWRMLGLEQRIEEGLNEQGEAPPPYMPGQAPPAVHMSGNVHGSGNPIPLQEFTGKPPDYRASSSEEDLGLARPAPMHYPQFNRPSGSHSPASIAGSDASNPHELTRDQTNTSTTTLLTRREGEHEVASKETDPPTNEGRSHHGQAPVVPSTTSPVAPEAAAISLAKETHGEA